MPPPFKRCSRAYLAGARGRAGLTFECGQPVRRRYRVTHSGAILGLLLLA
ncbi:hypothetical protein KCP70_20855 [Salmonella enterica subsp. enterica]|nr:hypothetical protein KCP70_20855 [Salmonella enterica subsp. enterica]